MELSLVVLHHHGEKSQERHKHILEKLCTKDFDIALLESRVVANAKLGANKFATLVADDLDPLGIAPGSPTLRKSRRSPPAQKIIRQIPKCRLSHGQAEHVIASQLYSNLFDGSSARRIVKIPVDWSNFSEQPSCSYGNNSPGPMFCIPLLNHDKVYLDRGRLKFHSLDEVLKLCRNSSVSVDPETRFLLLQLEEWLSERQSTQSRFLRLLFSRPASHLRLISCAHNPAHPYEVTSCIRKCQYRRRSFEDGPLSAEVCAANRIRNKMMELEKTDKFIMNPIHGSHLPYRVDSRSQLVKYQSRDRKRPVVYKVVSANTPSDGSDCDSLTDEYPLHKYAAQGNTEGIHKALKLGHDPDQLDRDLWAPIHYAAWYGHLGAVKALINYGRCSINLQNKNGSTPLHFATWWGHQYVVELLLCHPDLKPSAALTFKTFDAFSFLGICCKKLKDNDGKTPLEHCDAVPKPEWQNIAKLLRGAESEKLPKIQVDLMDGTNVMVTLVKGKDTTAAQLLQQIFVELQLPPESRLLFALWLCSEAIQLQLKSEHKPVVHMSTWRKKLVKLSDHPSPSTEEDRPRLELRRDAKLTLNLEKRIKLNEKGQNLLFSEAHANYISGLYPCSNEDSAMLAAILLKIIQGSYSAKKIRLTKDFLSNQRTMEKILPPHKYSVKGSKWITDIIREHKHVSSKASKNISGLQYQFLSFCWNLRVYGSAFFNAIAFVAKPIKGALPVHVGVNDFGLHLINSETKAMFRSYSHDEIRWSFTLDRPYIELRTTSSHVLTLQTKQAALIHTLLTKFSQDSSPMTINMGPQRKR